MNACTSLMEHKRIVTTLARAKALRPFAEKIITSAKKCVDTQALHIRRLLISEFRGNEITVSNLIDNIAPLFTERNGGYTRIVKYGYRRGDSAPMAIIELVA